MRKLVTFFTVGSGLGPSMAASTDACRPGQLAVAWYDVAKARNRHESKFQSVTTEVEGWLGLMMQETEFGQ